MEILVDLKARNLREFNKDNGEEYFEQERAEIATATEARKYTQKQGFNSERNTFNFTTSNMSDSAFDRPSHSSKSTRSGGAVSGMYSRKQRDNFPDFDGHCVLVKQQNNICPTRNREYR